jgi:hypothetical protein
LFHSIPSQANLIEAKASHANPSQSSPYQSNTTNPSQHTSSQPIQPIHRI